MMGTLKFMDCDPVLRDGGALDFDRFSHVRCNCMNRANLVARVRNGKIVWSGCPVCGQESVVEVGPDGHIGFFPVGVVVL
jgi:hypothetical protein